jgi:hypothetical protein
MNIQRVKIMPTVSVSKIINKFLYGELAQLKAKGESMPLDYLALIQECTTLEDLIDAINGYYDMRSRASACQHILNVMDYEDD